MCCKGVLRSRAHKDCIPTHERSKRSKTCPRLHEQVERKANAHGQAPAEQMHIPETMAAAIRIPPRQTATSIPFATVIDALYSLALACPSLPVLMFGFVVHLHEEFNLPLCRPRG
jgi:hypothetical protein